jgi:transcriptional regulator GlxA family with amidase domain
MLKQGEDQLRYIDWNNLHFALEWIYQGTPSQKSRNSYHSFPGLSAWLIGKGDIRIIGETYSIHAYPGEWVFPPFKKDERILSDDLELLSLRFEASWGAANELFQEENPRVCGSEEFPALERLAKTLLKTAGPRLTDHKSNMKFQPVDIYSYAKTHRVFMRWIEAYLQVMTKIGAQFHRVKITDERVRKAKSIIDTVRLDATFREQELAEKVGVSVAQLNRIFVKDMGITPTAYYGERKFRNAKRMLINSPAPIKQIGYELGFSNPANFTNWFSAKAQLSPRAFRRQAMH